jgi:hypothetical protein
MQIPHGFHCTLHTTTLHRLTLNATSLRRAVDRLRRFHFVGLFEEFDQSIRLFDAMRGRDPVPAELRALRVHSGQGPDAASYYDGVWIPPDPWDSLLHRVARKRFDVDASIWLGDRQRRVVERVGAVTSVDGEGSRSQARGWGGVQHRDLRGAVRVARWGVHLWPMLVEWR